MRDEVDACLTDCPPHDYGIVRHQHPPDNLKAYLQDYVHDGHDLQNFIHDGHEFSCVHETLWFFEGTWFRHTMYQFNTGCRGCGACRAFRRGGVILLLWCDGDITCDVGCRSDLVGAIYRNGGFVNFVKRDSQETVIPVEVGLGISRFDGCIIDVGGPTDRQRIVRRRLCGMIR